MAKGAGRLLARLQAQDRRGDGAKAIRSDAGAGRVSGAHALPRQGRRQRSARLPRLRRRAAFLTRRTLRRVHRLLELSGMQIHPQVRARSEEHTSELQSLMRISYAVFCLKKKNKN